MWSVVEKTALAEAEIEYHDHTSTTVWVKFPVAEAAASRRSHGAAVVIWTTTPWTLPGNRAIAYGDGHRLRVVEVGDRGREGSLGARRRAPRRWPRRAAQRSRRTCHFTARGRGDACTGDDLAGTVVPPSAARPGL